MFNIQKIFVYFVLKIFITSIIYLFLDYKNNNKNNNNQLLPWLKKKYGLNNYNLILSFIISLILTFILIYIKES